jgi:hypothetical protein
LEYGISGKEGGSGAAAGAMILSSQRIEKTNEIFCPFFAPPSRVALAGWVIYKTGDRDWFCR